MFFKRILFSKKYSKQKLKKIIDLNEILLVFSKILLSLLNSGGYEWKYIGTSKITKKYFLKSKNFEENKINRKEKDLGFE